MTQPPKPGQLIVASLFSEPMRVETVSEGGKGLWRLGLVGTRTACFPWHGVSTVQHDRLQVDAMTQPMQVSESPPPFGEAEA